MNSKLLVRGQVAAVRELRDPETKRLTGYSVQFFKRNGRNTFDLLNVRLPETADPSKFAEGAIVELPVDVSAFDKNVFYRASGDAESVKADSRPAERPAQPAAKP